MIRDASRLRQIDLRWEREAYYDLSFIEALAIYARLWQQALRLNPDPIAGWREDLASDRAIARDIEDAESIARRQARTLDWDYVKRPAARRRPSTRAR